MAYGQKSAVYEYSDSEYLEGLELYENQKFATYKSKKLRTQNLNNEYFGKSNSK